MKISGPHRATLAAIFLFQAGNMGLAAFIIGRMHPVRVGETDGSMIYNMVDDAGRALFGADRKPLTFVVPKAIR